MSALRGRCPNCRTFTAVAIGQLVDQGKVSLDDPLTKYLPTYPKPAGDQITIAMLLGHTAGTGDYLNDPGYLRVRDTFASLRELIGPRTEVDRDALERARAQIAKAQAYKHELGLIYAAVERTRSEMTVLGAEAQSNERTARASRELAAIVGSTEQATQSILQAATSVDNTLTVMLAGIAIIALVVGGIGVMNIMLVSVTERIREIGVRKAIGARPGLIRRQFLVEASVLGFAGGVLGVLLGIVGAVVVPAVSSSRVVVSAPAILLALLVAVGIGVAFGVYPATRAARLAPIDALRNE